MRARKLYESSNGDRWFLICDSRGDIFVRHEANASSGGHVSNIEIRSFSPPGTVRSRGSC